MVVSYREVYVSYLHEKTDRMLEKGRMKKKFEHEIMIIEKK